MSGESKDYGVAAQQSIHNVGYDGQARLYEKQHRAEKVKTNDLQQKNKALSDSIQAQACKIQALTEQLASHYNCLPALPAPSNFKVTQEQNVVICEMKKWNLGDGVAVMTNIYRGGEGWILDIVAKDGTSTIWKEQFCIGRSYTYIF